MTNVNSNKMNALRTVIVIIVMSSGYDLSAQICTIASDYIPTIDLTYAEYTDSNDSKMDSLLFLIQSQEEVYSASTQVFNHVNFNNVTQCNNHVNFGNASNTSFLRVANLAYDNTRYSSMWLHFEAGSRGKVFLVGNPYIDGKSFLCLSDLLSGKIGSSSIVMHSVQGEGNLEMPLQGFFSEIAVFVVPDMGHEIYLNGVSVWGIKATDGGPGEPGGPNWPFGDSELCGNGIDDDMDGLTDCEDSECGVEIYNIDTTTDPPSCGYCEDGIVRIQAFGKHIRYSLNGVRIKSQENSLMYHQVHIQYV